MLAPRCSCAAPQVFSDTCHKCGHLPAPMVSASTQRLALAIAEVALGYRKVGNMRGAAGGR